MKNKILGIVLCLLNVGLLIAQEQKEGICFLDNEPLEEVLKKAQEQNKLVFIDCYTVWCGPCKALAKEIFPQKSVGDFFNTHFVSVKYDMERGEGKIVWEKYKKYIPGFPSLLLLNTEGKVVQQMVGYYPAEELIAGMKSGMEGNSIFVLQERYDSGARDFETIRDYVAALYRAFQRAKIPSVIKEYLKTIPVEKLLEPEIWDLVGKHIDDPYSEAYQFVLAKIEKLQYQTKVNRYLLERQLNNAMKRAVHTLAEKSWKVVESDSLVVIRKQLQELQDVIRINILSEFPKWLCELKIIEEAIREDIHSMYDYLQLGSQISLLDDEGNFVVDSYRYIITKSRDRKMLNEILKKIIVMQNEMDKSEVKLLNYNYYDVIALAYEKLGQKREAREAKDKYEQLERERKMEVDAIFGKVE